MALGAIVWGAVCAAPASAQTVDVLTHAAYRVSADHLTSDDERFNWDARFGGDIDLVDYGSGRVNFLADYQVILGEQRRSFDPNQGNYLLAGSVSHRFAGLEAAAVFHHESHHLSDREKEQAVDWNMLGGRVLKVVPVRRGHIDTQADMRWVIKKSYVDYDSEFAGEARAVLPIDQRFSAIADGSLRFVGVDDSQDRGTQTGFRVEGGIRIEGRGAAVELFVAGERRVDPYPLEFGTAQWLTAGFRLLGR
jgi:hypothetical protein